MAVLTYNNYLRQLLSKYECILAFDTAADFLGLTNGGYRSAAQIFVTKKQNIEGTEQIKIDSFEQIECQEYHGLLCTTVNQTLINLLEISRSLRKAWQIIMKKMGNPSKL